MRKLCKQTGFKPLLWIEELDKVTFSDTNRKWLHTLIDAVYQMDGTVVITLNATVSELRKELGEAIIGRLDGSRDGGDEYVVLDFSPPKKKDPEPEEGLEAIPAFIESEDVGPEPSSIDSHPEPPSIGSYDVYDYMYPNPPRPHS